MRHILGDVRKTKTFAAAAFLATSLLSVSILVQPLFLQEAAAHKKDTAADLYVASFASSEILCYDGENGDFIDEFVESGSGGLDAPVALVFGENDDKNGHDDGDHHHDKKKEHDDKSKKQ